MHPMNSGLSTQAFPPHARAKRQARPPEVPSLPDRHVLTASHFRYIFASQSGRNLYARSRLAQHPGSATHAPTLCPCAIGQGEPARPASTLFTPERGQNRLPPCRTEAQVTRSSTGSDPPAALQPADGGSVRQLDQALYLLPWPAAPRGDGREGDFALPVDTGRRRARQCLDAEPGALCAPLSVPARARP